MADGGVGGDDAGHFEGGFGQEVAVLGFGAFLSAGAYEHHHVEEFSGVGSVAGGEDHFDEEETGAGCMARGSGRGW
jgi:hypothetical protein